MNDVSVYKEQVPDTLEDLSRFVLVGREKLVAVRAEIRAIQKVGLAQEVRTQKLKEAQAISEAVLDAEMRIGELMAQVPKASGGDRRSDNFKIPTDGQFEKTKSDVINDTGFSRSQVQRFETLAKHPEIVEQTKAEARENDDIVSRSAVLKKIKEEEHKPHIVNNSGNNEWYTPKPIVDAARDVLGEITLDPASSKIANETVQASNYFTVEDDGLTKAWFGKIWMNPPYSGDLVGRFIDKLLSERNNYSEAIVLVNNATETEWFSKAVSISSAICFPKGRIKYYSPTKVSNTPLQGQAVLYIGSNGPSFAKRFSEIGWVANIIDLHR